MAKFRVTKNFKFRNAQWTDADRMRALGVEVAVRIQNRTQRGLDEEGRKFAPYSPGYAARKGTSRVDLTLSGRMLNGLDVLSATKNSVKIGWADSELEALADVHQRGKGNMPVRPFLGVPDGWVRDIVKQVKDWIR